MKHIHSLRILIYILIPCLSKKVLTKATSDYYMIASRNIELAQLYGTLNQQMES